MARAVEAIFWDNDGILVETEPLYFQATRQVLATMGLELSEQQFVELFLIQGRGAWHLLEERGVSPDEIDRLRDQRNALYSLALNDGPPVIPGIASVLEALDGHHVMGVVTTSQKDHFDLMHRTTGLLGHFSFVLTRGDYGQSKPSPEPYLRAVERSGVDVDACVAIEDSERGLESATRAGIRCIVVPGALTRRRPFVGAHRVLDSVSDIPAALRSMDGDG